MNKRAIGHKKEEIAVCFLKKQGVFILETNFQFHKMGEIDIIGRDGKYLTFIEVKYRKTASAGHAAEAVNFKKIRQICKVADAYRVLKHISSSQNIRFDVIAIDGDDISWIKNAFPYAL